MINNDGVLSIPTLPSPAGSPRNRLQGWKGETHRSQFELSIDCLETLSKVTLLMMYLCAKLNNFICKLL